MRLRALISTFCMAFVGASPAVALSLAECDRVIYRSHGGENAHQDFGAGRVGYGEWWSQEGVYLDLFVVDCTTGQHLRTRVREERIGTRPPFDRARQGERTIADAMQVDPALFSFERLEIDLKRIGRDTVIAQLDTEPCACAALYPGTDADWAAFEGVK